MLAVIFRLSLRLFIFFIAVFFIFYFYVLGYRFESNYWFVETSGIFQINTYSKLKDKQIIINGKAYNITDSKIILENLINKESCGYLKIGNYVKYICYPNKNSYIAYIPEDFPIKNVQKAIYETLNLQKTQDITIKYKFKWDKIVFFYYNNGDLVYQDSISTKKLKNIKNADFIGYDSKWLYFVQNKKLFYMQIKQ